MRYIRASFKVYFPLLLLLFIFQVASGQYCNLQKRGIDYWHCKIASSLGLRDDQFKLAQLNEPVGSNSYWLWSIFNAVPENSGSVYYNPSQYNHFSSDYGLLLYQSKVPGTDTACNLNNAILTYIDADHQYAWNKTVDDLLNELANSQGLTINVDTTITDATDSCGPVKIKINASFNHILVFYTYPLAWDSIAKNNLYLYKPWLTVCYFKAAYTNINNSVLSLENWEKAFGPGGYLQAVCKAIIVADSGYIDIFMANNKMKFSTTTYFQNDPVLLGVLINSVKDYIH